MSRKPLPTWCFGLVVVRHPETKKYLLVHETGNRGWWLPGGRVEPGESFEVGAVRECKEEAGVDVELKGVLRVEFTPGGSSEENASGRMRLIFYAEPIDPNQKPKHEADKESIEAKWVTVDELKSFDLRGGEPHEWFSYLDAGGEIYPLAVFAREVTPAPIPNRATPTPKSGNERRGLFAKMRSKILDQPTTTTTTTTTTTSNKDQDHEQDQTDD